MELDDVLNATSVFTTECCNSLSLVTPSKSITQYDAASTDPPSVFSFFISSPLSSDCTISLTSNVTGTTFLPSSDFIIVAGSSGKSASRTFTISSENTATQLISVETSSCTQTVESDSFVLSVRPIDMSPPAPELAFIQFTDSGVSLTITFDSATNRFDNFESFNCSQLLSFVGAANSRCAFTSDKVLAAELGETSINSLAVGSEITLLADKIRARCKDASNSSACGNYFLNTQQIMIIAAATNPIKPRISLSVPAEVFECDPVIQLDPTGTYGSCGRDWAHILWSVSAVCEKLTCTMSTISTTALINFLNANYSSTDAIVEIPTSNELIPSIGDYSFTLSVTNILGQTSVLTKVISVIASEVKPSVKISGPPSISILRPNKLTLLSIASAVVCGVQSDEISSVSYTWKVFKGVQIVSSAVISSYSSDPRYFKVSPYQFDANTVYIMQVTAASSMGSYSQAQVNVVVGLSGVKALISGGSSRTLIESYPLLLDASGSVDKDYPTTEGLLTYTWVCAEFSPSYGAACPESVILTSTSVIYIPSNTFEKIANKTVMYSFTVTVENKYGSIDSFEQLVTIVAEPLPTVSLVSSSVSKFSRGIQITIQGSIDVPVNQTALAVWSSPDINSDSLESFALTPITNTFLASSINSTVNTINLVLGPNSLSGGTYTFILTGSKLVDAEEESVSDISIVVNSPPVGGKLTVSPSYGDAMQTIFTLISTGWSDEAADYPITYTLLYYTFDRSALTTIKPESEASSISTTLGEGLESMDYVVTCVARAFDIYSDSNDATSTVSVFKAPTGANLTALLSSSVATAQVLSSTEVSPKGNDFLFYFFLPISISGNIRCDRDRCITSSCKLIFEQSKLLSLRSKLLCITQSVQLRSNY